MPCEVNLSIFYIQKHISTLNFIIIRDILELLHYCFLKLIFKKLVEPCLPILTQCSKIDLIIIQTVSDMSKIFFAKLLLGFMRVNYINLDKI